LNRILKICRHGIPRFFDSTLRKRKRLAYRYLSGSGLEIGALHNPLRVPPRARVTYVDRMTEPELRLHYPELSDKQLVPVHVVDDGENPLLALQNWTRVLKKGGVLYLAVPNKQKTFDLDRPVTTISHVVRDYEEGPHVSRQRHFAEWVVLVNKRYPDKAQAEVDRLIKMNYSIHYHVWDPPAFLDLLRFCREERAYPLHVERSVIVGNEVIVILRKTG
jgi:SAM-dependent methyltransferase